MEANLPALQMPRELLAPNFLRQFRDAESRELTRLSAAQFTEVWNHYDNDGNGYIEGEELDAFLREFVGSVHPEQDGVRANML